MTGVSEEEIAQAWAHRVAGRPVEMTKLITSGGSTVVLPVPVNMTPDDEVELRRVVGRIQQARLAERVQRLLGGSGIPEMYRSASFDMFSGEKGKESALQAAMEWSDGELVFLTILGPYGTGKTMLATAALKERMRKSENAGVWRNFVSLITELQSHFTDERLSAASLIQEIASAPILLLDDLGVTMATQWQRAVLYTIVNERYTRGLPAVFTTNLQPSELADVIGARVVERLVEQGLARVVQMGGRNYRLKQNRRVNNGAEVTARR